MATINIKIYDDIEAGGVRFTSECHDAELNEDGNPSRAVLIAVYLIELMQREFASETSIN